MKKLYATFVFTLFIFNFSVNYSKEYSKKNSEVEENISEKENKVLEEELVQKLSRELKEQLKKELMEELKVSLMEELSEDMKKKLKDEVKNEIRESLKEKIIVMPVVNKSKIKEQGESEKLTSLIEEKMLENSKYEVINRSELNRIIEEQKMALYGITDETGAAQIGKIAGAKKAVIGSILGFSVNRTVKGVVAEIVVDIKIIDIESAKIFDTISLREAVEEQVTNSAVNSVINKVGVDFGRKLNGENVDTSEETEKYLKKVEFLKEDNKVWKLGTYYALVPFDMGKFKCSDAFIKFENDEKKYLKGIGVEVSKHPVFINFEYCNGAKYRLSKLGIGYEWKILKKSPIELKTGIEGNIAFFEGEIGKTLYESEIASKSFAENSKIYISATDFGIAPFIKCNLNISNSFTLFLTGDYRLYKDLKEYTLEIEDNGREKIKINGLSNEISLSGFGVRTGISYKF